MKRCLVALLCCVLASSCSWAFVKAPPSDHPTAADDCTESRAAPVLDTVFAGLSALTIAVASGLCYQKTQGVAQDGSPDTPCSTGAYVSLVWTGVVGIGAGYSAYTGFRDTGRCRARRALEAPVARAQ